MWSAGTFNTIRMLQLHRNCRCFTQCQGADLDLANISANHSDVWHRDNRRRQSRILKHSVHRVW